MVEKWGGRIAICIFFWIVVCFCFSLLILLFLLLVSTLDVLILVTLWKWGDRILVAIFCLSAIGHYDRPICPSNYRCYKCGSTISCFVVMVQNSGKQRLRSWYQDLMTLFILTSWEFLLQYLSWRDLQESLCPLTDIWTTRCLRPGWKMIVRSTGHHINYLFEWSFGGCSSSRFAARGDFVLNFVLRVLNEFYTVSWGFLRNFIRSLYKVWPRS